MILTSPVIAIAVAPGTPQTGPLVPTLPPEPSFDGPEVEPATAK